MDKEQALNTLESLFYEQGVDINIDTVKIHDWGTEINFNATQVDRNSEELFHNVALAEKPDVLLHELKTIEEVELGFDENACQQSRFKVTWQSENNTEILLTGWLTYPEYCDDESDGYLTGTVIIVDSKNSVKGHDHINDLHQHSIGRHVNDEIGKIARTIEKMSAKYRNLVIESDSTKSLMRALAA